MSQRCSWVGADPTMIAYHDSEWGVPVHDDRKLFEYMLLDAFQAGLSWRIVLNKRSGFSHAFANFRPSKVADFGETEVARLLADTNIIRNRQKIMAAITNAQRFLEVQKEFGSFDRYLWGFINHQPRHNHWVKDSDIPARTRLSDQISRDLVGRGFKFVGSTIVYAWLQAAGLVNDHLVGCYRYRQLVPPS